MLIAFEGPDKTGKSTSADNLAATGKGIYNMTKDLHQRAAEGLRGQEDLVVTFDRIDWLTHMVYRLAMPGHEWNDERPRTVFASPDTHLVFKVHSDVTVAHLDDELYEVGKLVPVNDMYCQVIDWLVNSNRMTGFQLFKSIGVMQVYNLPDGSFRQQLIAFDSPVTDLDAFWNSTLGSTVTNDEDLLSLLRYEDQHRL